MSNCMRRMVEEAVINSDDAAFVYIMKAGSYLPPDLQFMLTDGMIHHLVDIGEYVAWESIFLHKAPIDVGFLDEFHNHISWHQLSTHKLTQQSMEKYASKLDWSCLTRRDVLNSFFVLKNLGWLMKSIYNSNDHSYPSILYTKKEPVTFMAYFLVLPCVEGGCFYEIWGRLLGLLFVGGFYIVMQILIGWF